MKHVPLSHTGQPGPKPCPGCGLQAHQSGAQPTSRHAATAKESQSFCHGRKLQKKPPLSPATWAIGITDDNEEELDRPPGFKTISLKQLSTIDPAPTVKVHLLTHHGDCNVQVLSNSGATIWAAGEHILPQLNVYKDKLLPSEFTPRAANGQRMHAIEKMRVCW